MEEADQIYDVSRRYQGSRAGFGLTPAGGMEPSEPPGQADEAGFLQHVPGLTAQDQDGAIERIAAAPQAGGDPWQGPVQPPAVRQAMPQTFSDAAAMHERYQMANFRAGDVAALISGGASGAGGPRSGGDFSGDMSEAARSLENAAARMDKAFAGGKTVVLLKD